MKIQLSPSLMCMDLMNVERDIKILSPISSYFHIDILDWHYCRNLSLSPCFMEQLKKITNVPLEAHLMIDNIESDIIKLCLDSGADVITMPPEIIANRAFRLIRQIKDAGKEVGIYISPGMNLDIAEPYIHHVDKLKIMTVDPGFPAQKFIPESLDKIRKAKELRAEKGYTYKIQVDGSCNKNTYADLYAAGAEIFIVGSSGLFGKHPNLSQAIELMLADLDETLGA